ncbi:MAG: hypothetical protein ACI9QD_000990, partial [Thermoproteota archaeon]
MRTVDRTKQIDSLVISLATFVAMASLYLMFNEKYFYHTSGFQNDNKEQIASLSSSSNDIRKKSQSNIMWLPIEEGSSLYNEEMVFTGAASKARITFNDMSYIDLGNDSLVVLNKKDDQSTLEFHKGEISGNLGTRVKVKLKDGLELKGDASFTLKKTELGITLDVFEGEIELGKQKVAKAQKLIIKNNEIKVIEQIEIQSPLSNTRLWVKEGDQRYISFSWKAFTGANKYRFKLLQDGDKKIEISSKVLDQTKVKIKLLTRDQNYKWCVEALSANGESLSSIELNFQVRSIKIPQTLSPFTKTNFLLSKKTGDQTDLLSVPLRFKKSFSGEYLLEVAKTKMFKDLIMTKKLGTDFLLHSFAKGSYFWRVKSLANNERSESYWSDYSEFTIKENYNLDLPVILAPIAQQRFISKTKKQNISLKFNNISNYEVLLAKSLNFADNETKKIILRKSDGLILSDLQLGRYYIKTRQFNETKEVSDYSSVLYFDVELETEIPVPQLEIESMEIEVLNKQKSFSLFSYAYAGDEILQSIPLKWGEIKSAISYTIQIALDKGFKKKVLTKEVFKNKIIFPIKEYRTYYWRVSVKNKTGKSSNFSRVGIIKVKAKAVKLKKTDSFVYVKDRDSSYELAWPIKKGVTQYLLETKSSDQQQWSKTILKGNKLVVDVPAVEEFLWRVTPLDKGKNKIGDRSNISKINISVYPSELNSVALMTPIKQQVFKQEVYGHVLVDFKWNEVSGADFYVLHVSETKDFKKVLAIRKRKVTFAKIQMDYNRNKEYYWRVKAVNEAAKIDSNWAIERKFSFDVKDIQKRDMFAHTNCSDSNLTPAGIIYPGVEDEVEINLSWNFNDDNKVFYYEVYSANEKFIEKNTVQTKNHIIKVKNNSSYLVKVCSLGSEKITKSELQKFVSKAKVHKVKALKDSVFFTSVGYSQVDLSIG